MSFSMSRPGMDCVRPMPPGFARAAASRRDAAIRKTGWARCAPASLKCGQRGICCRIHIFRRSSRRFLAAAGDVADGLSEIDHARNLATEMDNRWMVPEIPRV